MNQPNGGGFPIEYRVYDDANATTGYKCWASASADVPGVITSMPAVVTPLAPAVAPQAAAGNLPGSDQDENSDDQQDAPVINH